MTEVTTLDLNNKLEIEVAWEMVGAGDSWDVQIDRDSLPYSHKHNRCITWEHLHTLSGETPRSIEKKVKRKEFRCR